LAGLDGAGLPRLAVGLAARRHAVLALRILLGLGRRRLLGLLCLRGARLPRLRHRRQRRHGTAVRLRLAGFDCVVRHGRPTS
jgi:hypothetical protein